MIRVAVTYSSEVGGASVLSLKKSFASVNCEVIDADYREIMRDISNEEFNASYQTLEGRKNLFAHAKAKAEAFLQSIDCLALSGNGAMIDPSLFNQEQTAENTYDLSRTIAELALLHVAVQKGMPVMGVCGGHQVVAVYGGGTIKNLNSTELDKQRFMNYDAITFNADSLLKKILNPKIADADVLRKEYFGAHNQAVETLGEGFKTAATASDGKLNEAAESIHGAPIITTQFHPEVSIYGLPGSEFIYKTTEAESKQDIKIFEYLKAAGQAYNHKKSMLEELITSTPLLKSAKAKNDLPIEDSHQKANIKNPKEQNKGGAKRKNRSADETKKIMIGIVITGVIISAILFSLFPPAGFLSALATIKITGAVATLSSILIGAAIGASAGALLAILIKPLTILLDKIKVFIRNKISDYLTNQRVKILKEKENHQPDPTSKLDIEQKESFSCILKSTTAQSAGPEIKDNNHLQEPYPKPAVLFKETPGKLWKKNEENTDESRLKH